ncbi:MAG: CHAT domain-containing protein, partial [Acidobacteriota bacterium]
EEALRRVQGILAVHPDRAAARLALGDIQARMGRNTAENSYRQAAAAFAADGNRPGQVRVLLDLTNFLDMHGRPAEATDSLDRAIEAAAGLDRPLLQARVAITSGWWAFGDADYDLLGPALHDLDPRIHCLVIIPDGPLYRLPFAALRDAAARPQVGLTYRICLAPSATTWLGWRQETPPAAPRAVLALVNPTVPADHLRTETSSLRDHDAPSTPAGETASPSDRQPSVPDLPYAREEARAIMRRLGNGTVLENARATPDAVKQANLGRFAIVHFATHMVVDRSHPERSGIVLADEDNHATLLRTGDIVDLGLAGRVVVLSGCDSASGEIVSGEGMIGLARAFLVAGAHAVVADLWPVRDDQQARVIDRFYAHLGDGLTLGDALVGARRDLVGAHVPTAGWAGLQVYGDGDLVPFPGGRHGWPFAWWQLALLAALLSIIAWRQARAATSAVR